MTQSVFVNMGPQVSAGSDFSFCDGAGPVTLDGTVTGGNAANYYYNWWSNPAVGGGISTPNVEDPTVNPTLSVTYYFQATDAIGCRSNTDSVVVNVKPRPKASAGGDRFVCDDAGAFCTFLNGSVANAAQTPGPYTYSWFPATGMPPGGTSMPSPCVHPTQSIVYTLVVTAGNGCSSVITTLDTASTVTVDVRNVPAVQAGPDKEICKGTTVQLNGFASGTGPVYAYSWTPNDAAAAISNPVIPSPTVGPAFTTQYTLTVTSNGCSASDTVNVVVNTLPTAAIQPPVSDICQGESITLIGNADGDPTGLAYIYSWVNGSTLSDTTSATTVATPTTTTTYQLYAGTTECIGFVDAITVTVKPTPITNIVQEDTIICYGQPIDLKANYSFNGTAPATPIVYLWTPSEGLSATDISNPTATPTHTTTYVATISVGGSCPTKDSVRVNVTPSLNVAATADTTVICGNNGTGLHASGGLGNPKYTWSPASAVSNIHAQHPQFVDTTAGVTVVTLTIEEGGCTETDNISLTVHPGPTSDYYASHKEGCVPMEVNFLEKTTNTTNFIWHFGDGQISNNPNPTHVYTQPGTYLVDLVALGAGGCSDMVALTTITVSDTTFGGFVSNPPIDSLIYVPNAKVVFTDTTRNSVAWVWDFGDGKTSSDKSPTHLYQIPNEYSVSLTVTNEHGCVSHITHAPYRVVSPELMIPNVFTPNGDGLHDKWELMYSGKGNIDIKTYDRWGKLLFTSSNIDTQWDGTNKQGNKMSDGVYFYEVKVDEKVYTGNVTILR
jgi:gliding motility-associated-like protein